MLSFADMFCPTYLDGFEQPEALLDRLGRLHLLEVFDDPLLDQVDESRQAKAVRELEQVDTTTGRHRGNLIGVQEAQQLVERVLSDTGKLDLKETKIVIYMYFPVETYP